MREDGKEEREDERWPGRGICGDAAKKSNVLDIYLLYCTVNTNREG